MENQTPHEISNTRVRKVSAEKVELLSDSKLDSEPGASRTFGGRPTGAFFYRNIRVIRGVPALLMVPLILLLLPVFLILSGLILVPAMLFWMLLRKRVRP